MEYKCEFCNYTTKKKYNFDKHLLSNKHRTMESKSKVSPGKSKVSPDFSKENEIKTNYSCKYCGQQYKHKQSVTKHIKYSCTQNKTEDLTELVRLLNLQLEHKDKQIETQSKQIEKLMCKLEINNYTQITNNNTFNVNLLNYKNTDTSHLTDLDYRKCIKNPLSCVLNLIEKVHFNPEKPENMNIYIPSLKDKYIMMYQDNKWMCENREELNTIYRHKEELIEYWIHENKDDEIQKFFNRYSHIKDEEMGYIMDKLKLMMFNKRDLIKKIN
jgi:hypothetical protein